VGFLLFNCFICNFEIQNNDMCNEGGDFMIKAGIYGASGYMGGEAIVFCLSTRRLK
jgi:hypothetical protein